MTVLGEGLRTPAPWINVIANPSFGFLVSESGSGHTWSLNSHENQLTPWSNDPVSDPPGEAIYVRDENTGDVWSPTALPIRDETAPYISRHGQGYSRFHHGSHGILARAPAIRTIRRSNQDFPAHSEKRFRPPASSLRHCLRRVGVGQFTQRLGALHHLRNWIRRPERSSHRARGEENSAGASPLRTLGASSLR